MLEIFQYSFMLRAIFAGIVIAVIAPLIGNFLVIKRLSLIADTLSHIALTGVAIGLLTNTQPILTTVISTIVAAIAIEQLRIRKNIPGETILAMFLPGGLALSLVLISLANGFNVNLFSYLFGSITTVKYEDLVFITVLGIVIIGIVIAKYKQLLYTAFDEESAKVSGIHVTKMNTLLVVLAAITVSLAMRIVGILLIGALMVIPVVTAMQVARSFKQNIFYSILFALSSVLIGLISSFYLNIPAGGAIVLISLGIFSAVALVKKK